MNFGVSGPPVRGRRTNDARAPTPGDGGADRAHRAVGGIGRPGMVLGGPRLPGHRPAVRQYLVRPHRPRGCGGGWTHEHLEVLREIRQEVAGL